eukprot:g1212.t1
MLGLFSKKNKSAHLGDENTLYYNTELKRWVERGKEHEVSEDTLPPPPVVSSGVSQKRTDSADPSSRYVVAGGFGRVPTESIETEKFSLFTPAPVSNTQTMDFFVPQVSPHLERESRTPVETESSTERLTEKYKGFRIPRFQKPEGVDGSQQEYEEKELQKWKAKIDKREARKRNGIDTTTKDEVESTQIGSENLNTSWQLNHQGNPDLGFGMTQSANLEQVFGSGMDDSLLLTSTQTASVLPVQTGMETQGVLLNYNTDTELQMQYPEQNGQHSWMNNADPVSQLEGEIDFNSWIQPEENKTVNQDQSDASKAEENPYSEAEFPGGVRETDDFYDIAWLTQTGWTDQEQCKAITLWLCQNYQQQWRNWHRSDPVWDQFWCWYYDGGDEIIYSAPPKTSLPAEDGLLKEETKPADPHMDSGMKTKDTSVQKGEVSYTPEDHGDIWGAPEPQESVIKHQEATPSQEMMSCSCDIIGNKSSSKLSPWEDALLFSVPDLWMDSPLTSDDESEVGTLPFTVFTRDGMLQFLQKLDFVLSEINCQTFGFGEFHQQVKQLLASVEAYERSKNQLPTNFAVSSESFVKTEGLSNQLVVSSGQSTLDIKIKELEELVTTQGKTIEVLRTNFNESEATLQASKNRLEGTVHEIKVLEIEVESKEKELNALRDQLKNHVEANSDLFHHSSEEDEKLKKENKALKKKLLSLMKKSEAHSMSSNPASPTSLLNEQTSTSEKSVSSNQQSETNGQLLNKQINVLKRKLLQQKKALEKKESQVSQLMESEKQKIELSEAMDQLRQELEEKGKTIDELRASLCDKESQISSLTIEQDQKVTELKNLQQQVDSASLQANTEQEIKTQHLLILEQELQKKQQDIIRLEIRVENAFQKDSLISKLTTVIGENDIHIQQLRNSLQASRIRETELIESLAAKDCDLENLVSSLMFSQKQLFRLQDYCSELGGHPNELLTELNTVS